jgi:8-oxo-dGTP pyrophosphatase MutT (NUDIX family)
MHPIRIAAAVILDETGQTLLVRKRGTTAFMQAGGKIEPDETPLEALKRELKEELDIDLGPEAPDYLGLFSAPAANEEGRMVEAEVFLLRLSQTVQPAAELEEIRWIDPRAIPPMSLAPLTRDHLLPTLVR